MTNENDHFEAGHDSHAVPHIISGLRLPSLHFFPSFISGLGPFHRRKKHFLPPFLPLLLPLPLTKHKFVGFFSTYASYKVNKNGQWPPGPSSCVARALFASSVIFLTLLYKFRSSLAKLLLNSFARPKSLGIFLMATRRMVGKWMALYTWPYAPAPSKLLPGVPRRAKLLPFPFRERKPFSPYLKKKTSSEK